MAVKSTLVSTESDTAEGLPSAPIKRDCSRCEGTQHLLASQYGFGKYRCEDCAVVVGFDIEADPREFIIERGVPSRYSKGRFGPRLSREELQL